MARIIALDYGRKRTGIAVTDPLQLIASGLETVQTANLLTFLEEYIRQEDVERIVVGEPRQMDNTPSEVEPEIRAFIDKLAKALPDLPVSRQDERFTSRMAVDAMVRGGMKKQRRKDKATVDRVSATLILQSYLSSKQL